MHEPTYGRIKPLRERHSMTTDRELKMTDGETKTLYEDMMDGSVIYESIKDLRNVSLHVNHSASDLPPVPSKDVYERSGYKLCMVYTMLIVLMFGMVGLSLILWLDARSISFRVEELELKHQEKKRELNNVTNEVWRKDDNLLWPQGSYGILTGGSCPKHWFEFTECFMTSGKVMGGFSLNLGACGVPHSVTLRYCFKGFNVPSRSTGGFWVRTQSRNHSNLYVIRNTHRDCKLFGKDGGSVDLDMEDRYRVHTRFGNKGLNGEMFENYHPHGTTKLKNNDVSLSFCQVGAESPTTMSEYITVGAFAQVFGLFSKPDILGCPGIRSPYGILTGRKEVMSLDIHGHRYRHHTKVRGETPFVIDATKRYGRVGMCVYNSNHR